MGKRTYILDFEKGYDSAMFSHTLSGRSVADT